jgi:hypothetical protein
MDLFIHSRKRILLINALSVVFPPPFSLVDRLAAKYGGAEAKGAKGAKKPRKK